MHIKRNLILTILLAGFAHCAWGIEPLNLDSCRNLALKNNHELKIAESKIEAAKYTHKAAVTNFFPKISASGSYLRNQKEMSILSNEQKQSLSNLGTSINGQLTQTITELIKADPAIMQNQHFLAMYQIYTNSNLEATYNALGSQLVDDMRTDTRNVYAGIVTAEQPVFVGGKIIAYSKLTKYGEQLAETQKQTDVQNVLYNIDKAYWLVVSLTNKQKLAQNYVDMLTQLDSDAEKMIAEGVATKADGLTIKVKLNEAEMQLTKSENGLSLSRMLLCQLCGLDLNDTIHLVDENLDAPENLSVMDSLNVNEAMQERPELHSLSLATDMYHQKVNIVRADYLPKVALVGNYVVSNPNMFNGYSNQFAGMWNVGVMVNIPICHWGEGYDKTKAAKAEADEANSQLVNAKEQIKLQVNQSYFKIKEETKRLKMATENLNKADENLRYARLSYEAGVISSTTVLEAHTAWQSAEIEKIDAQIDLRLARENYKKSLGILGK